MKYLLQSFPLLKFTIAQDTKIKSHETAGCSSIQHNQPIVKVRFHFLSAVFMLSSFLLTSIVSFAQTTELWGTNFRGGDDNLGRVLKVNAAGVVSQAYGFRSSYPGNAGSLVKPLAYNGHLFILSAIGGKFNGGVITKYNPVTNISETVVNFNTATGFNPSGCNLLIYNNKFYGLTTAGGANNEGTIYEFDPATNVFTKKFDMTTALGKPGNSRFEVFNNKFYTCTSSGGANGFGTLMEYDPLTNTCVKKLDLTNDGTIGRGCTGGLTLLNGKLYGSMRFIDNVSGCIFEYDPVTNIYTKKIILDQSTTVRDFTGRFVADGGVLYASCNQGAGQFGQGAIVEYNPTNNVLTTKIQFDFSTGAGSFGDLLLFNGKYYGINTVGGANSGGGFFEWDPIVNSITQRKPMGGSLGNYPQGSFEILNNKLYATCNEGQISFAYKSTMVEWDVPANTVTRKFIFGSGNGEFINTKLLYHNGKVYGTTPKGGSFENGVLFSIDVNTGAYTQLHQFEAVDFNGTGISPLSVFNNKLYGVTFRGGASATGSGYIFEWDIVTATFTKKINLNSTSGNRIVGQMYLHTNDNFYGITQLGGSNSTGTIFRYNPSTNVYTVLTIAPQSATGGFVAAGSLLYVPTKAGGNGYGSVYAFNIATSTGVPVASYNASIGSAEGEFTLYNGLLYGSNSDGSNFNGNILAFNTSTNNFTIAKTFSAAFPFGASNLGNGSNGMLTVYNNELYGSTIGGGLNSFGTTFKYNPATNILTKLEDHQEISGSAITNSNGFITVQTNAVLPVKFSYFDAINYMETSAVIKWGTAQEINSYQYEIEQSDDAILFEKIGTVSAAGNTSSNMAYTFVDNNPTMGINYYRIKQLDVDGEFVYTPVKKLVFGKISSATMKVYPNPTNGLLTIETLGLPNNKLCQVSISNALGTVIQKSLLAINTGNKLQLNLLNLPKGIYFVQLVVDTEIFTEKIILE